MLKYRHGDWRTAAERVNRILEALAANDLRLKIEAIDRGSIIDGFQKSRTASRTILVGDVKRTKVR